MILGIAFYKAQRYNGAPSGSVAQLDRASAFEAEGCRFESCRVRHIFEKASKINELD